MATGTGEGGVIPSADDFLEGDVYDFDAAKPSSPEIDLFLAVVFRMWEDAFVCGNSALKTTDRRCQPDMIRAAARRWLLLDFGDWKADREEICAMAGLDPDVVHAAAVKRLELAHVEDQERTRTERAAIDKAFAAMLERDASGTITPSGVTTTLRVLADREACL